MSEMTIVPAEVETLPAKMSSPLDMPIEAFQSGLDRRGANRTALMKWVKTALVDGVDYGSINIGGKLSKPSLWKPGAEKICGMLGLIVHFPTFSEYEKAALSGVELKDIIMRCEIRDASGNVIADGIGARNVGRDKGDLNKALKMACKSAHIAATLSCAGLSEIFTQDLEDMTIEQKVNESSKESINGVPVKQYVSGLYKKYKEAGLPWSELVEVEISVLDVMATGTAMDLATTMMKEVNTFKSKK